MCIPGVGVKAARSRAVLVGGEGPDEGCNYHQLPGEVTWGKTCSS